MGLAARRVRCGPDIRKLDHSNRERRVTCKNLLCGRALDSHGCNHPNRNAGLLEDGFAAADTADTIDRVFGLTKGRFDLQTLCRG